LAKASNTWGPNSRKSFNFDAVVRKYTANLICQRYPL
jgi:hypothetical protein